MASYNRVLIIHNFPGTVINVQVYLLTYNCQSHSGSHVALSLDTVIFNDKLLFTIPCE